MLMRRASKERLAGSLLVLLGVAAAAKGSSYQIGTLARMGPGFFPVALGVLLALCGLLIVLGARNGPLRDRAEPLATEWRGWICIGLSLVSFVVLARHGGLLPATFAIVFIAALGDRQSTVKGAMLLALAISAVCVTVFWWGLKIQLPLFGWA
jgi:hypothetical protein